MPLYDMQSSIIAGNLASYRLCWSQVWFLARFGEFSFNKEMCSGPDNYPLDVATGEFTLHISSQHLVMKMVFVCLETTEQEDLDRVQKSEGNNNGQRQRSRMHPAQLLVTLMGQRFHRAI